MQLKLLPLMLFLVAALLCPSAFALNMEKLADDDWLHITSPNFEIITDLDEETGRQLTKDLEDYRYFSIQRLGLIPIAGLKPLTILAIGQESNFKNLDLPEMWGGVFNLSSYGYSAIANVKNYTTNIKMNNHGRQTLFHEYNHFLIRFSENSKTYPKWYDEGMADYWSTFRFKNDKVFIGDPNARDGSAIVRGGTFTLDSEKLLKFTTLPLKSHKTSDEVMVGEFYAQSFYLIHYLNSSPELTADLDKYINYLNLGYTVDAAFQKAFNMTYADLDKNAKKYFGKRLVMLAISSSAGKFNFPTPVITINKLDKPAFYSEILEILPNYTVMNRGTIKQLIDSTIALNPNNINAKMLLVTHDYIADPQKMLQELEQQAPKNSRLLTYKGDILRNNANALRAAGISKWEDPMKQARGYYRRAINAEPSLPLAYFGLGDVYNFLPASESLQEGVAGFDTASLYARDEMIFAGLATLLIRMDKGVETLSALRNTIAFSKEKEKSNFALILDNIELLKDVTLLKGVPSPEGLIYSSGAIFIGQATNGKPVGMGKISRPNGSYFSGNFIDGVMQGQGKLVTYGGYTFDGEFKKGIARGRGKITYPENSWAISYEGEIEYGIPHGKGIAITKSGKYEGDFWYSKSHGQGTLYIADSKIKLSGKWIENNYEWPEENDNIFIGSVGESGKRNGAGICKTPATGKIIGCTYKDGELQTETTLERIAAE
ncbi:MAG: hypothetical protein V4660_01815 [Pseudomonadota bacterium]